MVSKNIKNNKEKLVFGFDVGLGSLGVAVRKGDDIVEAHSYIIDALAGDTKDKVGRRRAHLTREAHKQREKRLEEVWKENVGEESLLYGIQIQESKDKNGTKVFKVIEGDERLEREFPKKGDNTVYNSALLRIMLIEGKKLEHWQIYKALRSAIQRRGYDSNIPWGNNSKDQQEQKEDKDKKKEMQEQVDNLEKIKEQIPKQQYHLSCYYDAFRMGLWDPKKGIISIRNSKNITPQRARGYYRPNREEVKLECIKLLEQATKLIPVLEGKTEYILYGQGSDLSDVEYQKLTSNNSVKDNLEYAFIKKDSIKKSGGILSSKYPRFNNRCVNSCSQIPHRFKVCKSSDPLNIEVWFLWQLKNISYICNIDNSQDDKKILSIKHIDGLFNSCCEKWNTAKQNLYRDDNFCRATSTEKQNIIAKKMVKYFEIDEKKIKSFLNSEICKDKGIQDNELDVLLSGLAKKKYSCNISGRCRFSRPALVLLRALLLSGQDSKDFYNQIEVQGDFVSDKRFEKYKLKKEDIQFLLKCG